MKEKKTRGHGDTEIGDTEIRGKNTVARGHPRVTLSPCPRVLFFILHPSSLRLHPAAAPIGAD